MDVELPPKYSTAIYAHSPPSASTSASSTSDVPRDPQAIQAALSQLVNHIRRSIAHRIDTDGEVVDSDVIVPPPARWFLQIRSLRLAIPSSSNAGSSSQTTRTMYMLRNASLPGSVTLVIEDPSVSAVNISTLSSGAFDYFLSTSLLPSIGGNSSAGRDQPQQQPGQSGQGPQQGRWIPRPTFVQIEGLTIKDSYTDFRISVGMLSARGGASQGGGSVAANLVLQVEYLPTPFLPASSSYMLEEYLSSLLPKNSSIKDLSGSTTTSDWKSLLGVHGQNSEGKRANQLPEWSARNTSWCLIKMCKENKMV